MIIICNRVIYRVIRNIKYIVILYDINTRKERERERENDFAQVSKNRDTDLKIILINHQNNYLIIKLMLCLLSK